MQIEIGSVVKSDAGRDRGYFAVVRIEGKYVYLADGRTRTAEKPKKKNIRHITATQDILADVAAKINEGKNVGRETLKKSLAPYGKNGGNCLCQKTTS